MQPNRPDVEHDQVSTGLDWSGERTTLSRHAAMAQVAAGRRQLSDVPTDRRRLWAA